MLDKNTVIATRLFVVSIAMFGFGYALVPLYDVLCDVTGINGKSGDISLAEAVKLDVNNNRTVTVEFDTNVNNNMPWSFRVENSKLQVHPGEINEAVFIASNQTNQTRTGQAIPSVAPGVASLYFKKIECFCFTQQTLGPGESKRMPVKFVVKPEMPENIRMLTLSYTFFPVSSPAKPEPSHIVPSS